MGMKQDFKRGIMGMKQDLRGIMEINDSVKTDRQEIRL